MASRAANRRKPSTEDTIRHYLASITKAGLDPDTLNELDYKTLIQPVLGWSEATFKTFLAYHGRSNASLQIKHRDYIPTEEEICTMEEECGDAGRILSYLGCRFSELWHLSISPCHSYIEVDTVKGGNRIQVSLRSMSENMRDSFIRWVVMGGKDQMSPSALRKKWQRLQTRGVLSPRFSPHCLRHRLITRLSEAGHSPGSIAAMIGHKDIRTTYRYIHSNPVLGTEAREAIRSAT